MLDQNALADGLVGGPSRSAPRSDVGLGPRRAACIDAPRLDQGNVALAARRVLSPAQFKAALYAKGWTMRLLADYWGLSADYVRRLVGDPQRAPWWDNAVLGLPIAGPARKPRLSWSGESDSASVLAGLMRSAGAGAGARNGSVLRRPKGAGFRYWGYMVRGAVVAVAKHLGEMADEGMHGIVVQVIRERSQERYRIVFETGGVEMFSPDLVDEYLVTTGIERNGLVGYIWRGEEAVRQDFEAGMFVFEGAEV
jgi:hypothetical protein